MNIKRSDGGPIIIGQWQGHPSKRQVRRLTGDVTSRLMAMLSMALCLLLKERNQLEEGERLHFSMGRMAIEGGQITELTMELVYDFIDGSSSLRESCPFMVVDLRLRYACWQTIYPALPAYLAIREGSRASLGEAVETAVNELLEAEPWIETLGRGWLEPR